ncbi:MAG: SOS response-associated peptidase [Firmicutes bacterium]|nr:SOS response-associated peptidase [Bacillota bacterium]
MCGRFTLHTPIEEIVERFSLPDLPFSYIPSYNIAPTHSVLSIIVAEGVRSASLMRWGITPPWLKKGQSGTPLINARLETLDTKPTFRGLANSQRCLIIADGFYEWKQEKSRKYPVYIRLEGGKPFAFAGLWTNGTTPSCTIVTQEANKLIQPIHSRMPVILSPESEELWLSQVSFNEIRSSLPDQDTRQFDYYYVSTLVNSPRNNEAACILPISELPK